MNDRQIAELEALADEHKRQAITEEWSDDDSTLKLATLAAEAGGQLRGAMWALSLLSKAGKDAVTELDKRSFARRPLEKALEKAQMILSPNGEKG